MKLASLLVGFAIGFFTSLLLIAHHAHPYGGRLDAYGCHHDRKAVIIATMDRSLGSFF